MIGSIIIWLLIIGAFTGLIHFCVLLTEILVLTKKCLQKELLK